MAKRSAPSRPQSGRLSLSLGHHAPPSPKLRRVLQDDSVPSRKNASATIRAVSAILLLASLVSCASTRKYSSFGFGFSPLMQALTSSAISKASGGCYAQCPTGSKCNESTGLCEELPCRGHCADNEQCGADNRCHPGRTPADLENIKPWRSDS
jgi:hypothetical protein